MLKRELKEKIQKIRLSLNFHYFIKLFVLKISFKGLIRA
jgi:hypothetical protein